MYKRGISFENYSGKIFFHFYMFLRVFYIKYAQLWYACATGLTLHEFSTFFGVKRHK